MLCKLHKARSIWYVCYYQDTENWICFSAVYFNQDLEGRYRRVGLLLWRVPCFFPCFPFFSNNFQYILSSGEVKVLVERGAWITFMLAGCLKGLRAVVCGQGLNVRKSNYTPASVKRGHHSAACRRLLKLWCRHFWRVQRWYNWDWEDGRQDDAKENVTATVIPFKLKADTLKLLPGYSGGGIRWVEFETSIYLYNKKLNYLQSWSNFLWKVIMAK